jgi:hypothetical protein
MMGLLSIESVQVPEELALQAHAHLQKMGLRGFEGLVLWAGKHRNGVFYVEQTIIPVQTPLRLQTGICIYVDSHELHRINVWLFEHNMTLIAQLHSHPEDAYHSEMDNSFPITTSLGSFSLVIPNYAREPFSLSNCAVYRLVSTGWNPLFSDEVERIFKITR